MELKIFGDVLLSDNTVNFSELKRLIELPYVRPRYKISILEPDETIKMVIPESDIEIGGINYTESYQSGQRRNISLQLINSDGKYTPSVFSDIWVNTRFSFEIGLETSTGIVWFPKGVYVLGNIELTRSDSEKTVTLQLQDKFAIFEGKTGTLDTAYEIAVDSDIYDAVTGILNFSMGNGYILDYKSVYFDPSLVGMKTQQTIRAEQGENYGSVISALATQLSAEYYYNTVGNLCFYPINETVDDTTKPIIWTYPWLGRDLHNMSLNYKHEEIVNCVKVVGDNVDSGVYSATVENNNPSSPICIEQVGKRMNAPYTESNIWSDDMAYDLARYYLRKASFVGVDFSCTVSFNPVLTVNNLCEVEDHFLELQREKLLIVSLSYTSGNGEMSVTFCNTTDLPSVRNRKG